MSKHTNGPWYFRVEAGDEWRFGGGNQAVVGPKDGPTWTSLAVMSGDCDEDLANARLIAAAPDLLAECQKALLVYESAKLGPMLADLRAAIAKATGEAA